nr:TLC domain-containing protein 3A-like [Chelonoidis abingdonii]
MTDIPALWGTPDIWGCLRVRRGARKGESPRWGARASPAPPFSRLSNSFSSQMALIFLFSCCFFPLFFLALRWALHCSWALGMDQLQAIYVAAKLVSSIQAIMASTAGYIVFSSCQHVLDDQ